MPGNIIILYRPVPMLLQELLSLSQHLKKHFSGSTELETCTTVYRRPYNIMRELNHAYSTDSERN